VPGLVMATEDMAIEELMMDSEERGILEDR
jgi:hypothetical protein